jgi:hypothetical protein
MEGRGKCNTSAETKREKMLQIAIIVMYIQVMILVRLCYSSFYDLWFIRYTSRRSALSLRREI